MKLLPDKVYDILKWIAITAIPAFVVFFSTILPVLEVDPVTINKVTVIIGALGVLLATLLGVSTIAYNKTKSSDNSDAKSIKK